MRKTSLTSSRRNRKSIRDRRTRPARDTIASNYQKTVLANGVRVVTEVIPHVRSVSLGVWLNVGSRDETADRSGISHFIEHMVFKGTKRYRAHQIARSLESVGGYLNAFTSKEHTCFYAQVLDRHVGRAVDILSDLVQFPLFNPGELEKEKQVVLEELKNIEDDPDDLIHDYFDRSLFGEHPLGFPVIGRADSITAFRAASLFEYLHRYYLPDRMVVAAAGNLKHDTLLHLVNKYFRGRGSYRRNGAAPRLRAPAKRFDAKTREYEKPISQAHVCLGTLGCSVRSRSRYPILVLNTLLGEGMSSRLFQNIREKYGFAYNVYSFANTLSDTGTFGVYVGTGKDHIQNSIELIHRELDKLRSKGVSRAELQRTKEQLKGTMMLSLESMSSRMMRLGTTELIFGDYVPLDTILRSIDSVTGEDVHELAGTLFDVKRFSTVIFNPTEKKPVTPQSSGSEERIETTA